LARASRRAIWSARLLRSLECGRKSLRCCTGRGQCPTATYQSCQNARASRLAFRLHLDATRNAWVLLGPERIIETEGPASEILRRCDGSRTVAQIVDELAAVYTADRAEIAGDVTDMLAELVAKRMLAA